MSLINKIKSFLRGIRLFLIFTSGVAIILFLFPREGKFRYEFQKGKPWMHSVLVAPFNYPIYKPEALVQKERDSVLQRFIPYFNLDSLVGIRNIERVNQEFEKKWVEFIQNSQNIKAVENTQIKKYSTYELLRIHDRYLKALHENLNRIFAKGIVLDPFQLENIQNRNELVYIISGKTIDEIPASSVFTQKSAYENLKVQIEKVAATLENNVLPENRFIQSLDLAEFIEANLFYDEVTSNRMKESLMEELSITQGMVQAGEKIIALGEVVNDEKQLLLQSLKREYETNPNIERNYLLIILGQLIEVVSAFFVLYLFLLHFRREVLNSAIKTFFIVMLVVIMAIIAKWTINNETISLYVVPFVIVPIILKTFYDARIALFVHIVSILLVGFQAANGFEFVFMNFIAGVVSIFTLRNNYRRGILFVSAVLTFLSYSLVYSGISLMQEGRFQNIDLFNYAWFGGNALLVLTSYPLIFLFEKIFGFVSDATLVELADTNQPLLRKLAEKAPGTFQHSLQVANLCEEAVLKVGGNPLLARTGALYHDIGKTDDPMYFIENLNSGFNPHSKLTFEESAEKIISHVTRGVEIAQKSKLPGIIIDFIRTHHGTTTVLYFYRSYLKEYPGAEVDIHKFTYPGPCPFSKETAILMMADSIEAASRSLKKVDLETINSLVEGMITRQFNDQQFQNVDLTLRDIEDIKTVFKRKLVNIYHARIEYPE
jgi:putative nucleotidyltransferase with HDIG domain